MNGVTKRLVFHFYLSEDWEENIANKVHFRCLKQFSNVFDEAVVVISSKNADRSVINRVESTFLGALEVDTVTFKIVENTPYYESLTLKTEIIDKMGKLDGLTFFAHNKGVSNVNAPDKSNYSILMWIYGMYYFGLCRQEMVEEQLCTTQSRMFCGPFLMTAEYISNPLKCWYAGTFYWVNTSRLWEHYHEFNVPELSDRYFAESFPAYTAKKYIGTVGFNVLPDSDLYRNSAFFVRMTSGGKDEFSVVKRRFEDMIEDLGVKRYTVLTYNFGKYEIMRELGYKQENVEYIYVTDDKDLKSDTWTIVYDDSLDGLSPFEKVLKVRKNPFKYCHTKTCVRIDASIEVKGSLDKIVDEFDCGDYDLGMMVHPGRSLIPEEYDEWIRFRNSDPSEKEYVEAKLKELGYDLSIKGLYETGMMVMRDNVYWKYINDEFQNTFNKIKEGHENLVRVDQTIFSAVLNSILGGQAKPFVLFLPLSHSCIQSNVLCSMEHNSCFTCIVKEIPEEGWVNNEKKKLFKVE